jgi:hypothetical protein
MPPSQPISIRLDPLVRETLEQAAASEGIGLATYLRDLATERSATIRKSEIRRESQRIGELVRTDEEARAFYDAWGTPTSEL